MMDDDRSRYETMSRYERQSQVNDMEILSPRYLAAMESISSMHFPCRGGPPSLGTIGAIYGDPRSGKTYALKSYASRFPRKLGDEGMISHVVYMAVASDSTVRGVMDTLSTTLGLAVSRRINTHAATDRLIDTLLQQKVQLVIMDEFHRISDHGGQRIEAPFRGVIRQLLDEANISIIASGMCSIYNWIRKDGQLEGRGMLPHHLIPYYDYRNEADREEFELVCSSIDDVLPFVERSGLDDPSFCTSLLTVSRGSIGRLVAFMRRATAEAINDNARAINAQHFARVWDRVKAPGVQVTFSALDPTDPPKGEDALDKDDDPNFRDHPAPFNKRSRQ